MKPLAPGISFAVTPALFSAVSIESVYFRFELLGQPLTERTK